MKRKRVACQRAYSTPGIRARPVPEGYRSGVRVDASEHSSVSCGTPQCRQAVRTWEHPNRISFGTGEPVVRLSTVNGPVNVE